VYSIVDVNIILWKPLVVEEKPSVSDMIMSSLFSRSHYFSQ
jgi:hypothetical protein